MKEKLWPLIARMPHANKQSTSNLYRNICKKIKKNFVTESIIHSQTDVQSYNNLMETLSRLLESGTWTQQKITMTLLCLLLQKNVSMPLSCVKTFVDFLVHENIKLRKVCSRILIYSFDLFGLVCYNRCCGIMSFTKTSSNSC
jgi:hypothetical protein